MTPTELVHRRLAAQHLSTAPFPTVLAATEHLGALQAQDYGGALWGLGLRVQAATVQTIEQAIADRQIIRTWPMRGTLHFVPAADARWMIQLMSPRIIASWARRAKELDLDEATWTKAFTVFTKHLADGPLRRDELLGKLEAAGITTGNQRGYHLMWRAAQEALICLGPMDGKHPTFVLFDHWITKHNTPTRDEALAIMARRYFTSHGPATLKDFAGWTGLTMADAKAGITANKVALQSCEVAGTMYWYAGAVVDTPLLKPVLLLPGFDEYMLGYKDRSLMLAAKYAERVVPGGNGMFLPTIVSDGQIVGTWKRILTKKRVTITTAAFEGSLNPEVHAHLQTSAEAYARFWGVAEVIITERRES